MNLTLRLALTATATLAPLTAQDPIVAWNDQAIASIRAANTPPPAASRILAMLHTAIFDAVNGVRPRYEHYLVAPAAPRRASAEAANAVAAHDVLAALYPTRVAQFDALRDAQLAGIPDDQRRTDGIAWGGSVAAQILASRANDGSGVVVSYPGSNTPGLWRPTVSFGGIVRPALLPGWGNVTCFSLTSGAQFRPPAPPELGSLQYALEVLMVQRIGGTVSRARSADQTEVALFWGYGPGTATPPGHWNQIATAALAERRVTDLVTVARIYALLNLAMADAAISCWDCKYHYGLWRPITAIQLADQDGNPLTRPEPDWTPLLPTPPFPEYTSGHSTFSAAAATALAHAFGTDRVRFAVGSDDLPGVTRRYRSFSDAAWESGLSRIYGGIHFWSGNINALIGGYRIGDWVIRNELRPLR